MRENVFSLGLLGLASLALATGVGVGAAGAAQASPPAPAPDVVAAPAISTQPSTQKWVIDDQVCIAVQQADGLPTDQCKADITLDVDAAVLVADADELRAAGIDPAIATRTNPIYSRTWTQGAKGRFKILWTEVHKGKFYFNNSRAWVQEKHGGFIGYHDCDLGSGTVASVTKVNCDIQQDYSTHVDNRDQFRVHMVAKGVPIYKTGEMITQVFANGVVQYVPVKWI